LPWVRDAAVQLAWSKRAAALLDVTSSEVVPCASVDGQLTFVARKLPPLGYRTFVVSDPTPARPPSLVAGTNFLENEFFRVVLDPARCGIRSVICKQNGRELVNTQSPYALGQYLYERFDADQAASFTRAYVLSPTSGENISHGKPKLPPASQKPYSAATAGGATTEVTSNRVFVSALLKAPPRGIIPDATALRVTLYAGQPWLDLGWSITNKTADPWPEGGWLCFPVRADDPTFRLARLGSLVDPARDLVTGANHEIFCLNGGVLVKAAAGQGAGICPVDAQLVSLEHPGLWRYSRDFVPHKSDVFVLLFNNVYSTNFRQWIDGSWSSRLRLWATEPTESTDESLVGNSWEARVDCLAAVSDAKPGKFPATATGLAIAKRAGGTPSSSSADTNKAPRGLILTAFGHNPYGEGTLLRLWEQAGASGDYTVQLPFGMKARTAQLCNLRGEMIGPPLAISTKGTFSITTKPMAPVSLLLLGTQK
jgi:alpha-mannosidase